MLRAERICRRRAPESERGGEDFKTERESLDFIKPYEEEARPPPYEYTWSKIDLRMLQECAQPQAHAPESEFNRDRGPESYTRATFDDERKPSFGSDSQDCVFTRVDLRLPKPSWEAETVTKRKPPWSGLALTSRVDFVSNQAKTKRTESASEKRDDSKDARARREKVYKDARTRREKVYEQYKTRLEERAKAMAHMLSAKGYINERTSDGRYRLGLRRSPCVQDLTRMPQRRTRPRKFGMDSGMSLVQKSVSFSEVLVAYEPPVIHGKEEKRARGPAPVEAAPAAGKSVQTKGNKLLNGTKDKQKGIVHLTKARPAKRLGYDVMETVCRGAWL